jgi:Uma2 family endonuclease
MSTANQNISSWASSNVAVGPVSMSEEQFEHWILGNRDVRAEWVNGKVVCMSPVSHVHNALSIWITHFISAFLEQRPSGELLGPEFMIRLPSERSRRVPDLLFVSDSRRELIKPTYLDGAPDLAVEIISEDSQARDWREKYLEHEAAGVREYWIVDPFSKRVEAYLRGDDAKFSRIVEVEGKLTSTVLTGLHFRNDWLWATPRPTVASVLKELGIS